MSSEVLKIIEEGAAQGLAEGTKAASGLKLKHRCYIEQPLGHGVVAGSTASAISCQLMSSNPDLVVSLGSTRSGCIKPAGAGKK